ncbi:coiled-coil domain-containing protein [Streptomyces sp. NPDC088725]|uniref:coiled-coil domain-containing protein n=1 Tax=Streptomyces sp. NPDC088725 TaxID=3365873 RepID=UPI00381F04B7
MLRSRVTAALAAATVLAVMPCASPAAAAPGGDPAPGVSRTATTDAATSATAAPGPPVGGRAASTPRSVADLLTDLHRLYQQAEEATKAFDATAERLAEQTAATKRLGVGLTDARNALIRSREDAGRLARAQYQGQSGLSGYLTLLLARDPQQALDQGHLLQRAARGRAATIARLTSSEKRTGALARKSRQALDKRQVLVAKQKKQRDTVKKRLAEVERALASLSSGQIARLARLEKADTDKAHPRPLTSGALGGAAGPAPSPSARGARALR